MEVKHCQFIHTYKYEAIKMLTLAVWQIPWLREAKLGFILSPLQCLLRFNGFSLFPVCLVLTLRFYCCQSAVALDTSCPLKYGFLAWPSATSLNTGLATILGFSSSDLASNTQHLVLISPKHQVSSFPNKTIVSSQQIPCPCVRQVKFSVTVLPMLHFKSQFSNHCDVPLAPIEKSCLNFYLDLNLS